MGKSVGIDLGTTNSVVAYYDGRSWQVLYTRDETLTPSVVSYIEPSEEEDEQINTDAGTIVVGKSAVDNAAFAPEDTIFSIKRLMGRTINEDKVQEATRHFGYSIVDVGGSEDRGVRVRLHDRVYTPVQISAMILSQLKEDAEKALGEKVTHAVITVPAYFEERQRAATREAGRQAGLIVKQILDEPTAAAIAFGFERPEERHRVLVYDMGGGTFDVSLIQMTDQKFQQLRLEGDMWLGGDDFDNEIVKAIESWIEEKHGFNPSEDRGFRANAKQAAEKAKIALSRQEKYRLRVPAIVQSPLVNLDMVITRKDFNSRIQPYVDRSMDLVRQGLSSQHYTVDDITAVLMVGGATATPLVYEEVSKLFGLEKVRRDIDPMHCVAIGASILAASTDSVECPTCKMSNPVDATTCSQCGEQIAISGDTVKPSPGSPSGIGLINITAQSLGIGVVKEGKPDSYEAIIPKGTVWPLRKAMERVFSTTSKNMIRVPIYEGDEAIASKNSKQGDIVYLLPEPIGVGTLVTVSFNYDREARTLKVTIWVQGYPHLKKEVVLTYTGPLGPAAKPQQERDWQEEVQKTLKMSEFYLNKYRDFIDSGQATKMESDMQKAKQALADKNPLEAQRVMKALNSVMLGETDTASRLFLAENIMRTISQPRQGNELRNAIRELREAAERKDHETVAKASNGLKILLEKHAARMEAQSARTIDDRIDYGWLAL